MDIESQRWIARGHGKPIELYTTLLHCIFCLPTQGWVAGVGKPIIWVANQDFYACRNEHARNLTAWYMEHGYSWAPPLYKLVQESTMHGTKLYFTSHFPFSVAFEQKTTIEQTSKSCGQSEIGEEVQQQNTYIPLFQSGE